MQTVLVTGASGFIGSHLARRLAAGPEVSSAAFCDRVVGMCSGRSPAHRLTDPGAKFQLVTADLRCADALDALFARHRFTAVFHLAAHGVHDSGHTAGDPEATAAVNALGSYALGRAAVKYGVSRFVHCGSAMEYAPAHSALAESAALGGPNLYGVSKTAGWMLLDYLRRAEGLPLVTVRPFTVFGPGEAEHKLIPYVIRRALEREPVLLSAGTQLRDYLFVSDLVEALLLAAKTTLPDGVIFNIGAGPAEARTIRSVVGLTLDLMGAPRSLCRFGEARRERVDPPCLVADPALALSMLGWKPRVTLERGLRETISSVGASVRAAAA